MTSKFQWDEKILDGFAPSVSYVIRICTSHLATIVDKYGNSTPPPPHGFGTDGPGFDAMLEAGLMHLRSLDDFFRGSGSGGPAPDMRASDWFVGLTVNNPWKPTYWLDPRVRAMIDWNVVHLSTLRTMPTAPPQWKLADYGDALCAECERFFDLIAQHCGARLPAFEWNPRADIQTRAAIFAQYAGT